MRKKPKLNLSASHVLSHSVNSITTTNFVHQLTPFNGIRLFKPNRIPGSFLPEKTGKGRYTYDPFIPGKKGPKF